MKKDDLCIGTLDNKHIDVYLSIDDVKKMCDEKILNENVKLLERVFELEEENERLNNKNDQMKMCLAKIAEDAPDEMERERTKEGFINLAKKCLDICEKDSLF